MSEHDHPDQKNDFCSLLIILERSYVHRFIYTHTNFSIDKLFFFDKHKHNYFPSVYAQSNCSNSHASLSLHLTFQVFYCVCVREREGHTIKLRERERERVTIKLCMSSTIYSQKNPKDQMREEKYNSSPKHSNPYISSVYQLTPKHPPLHIIHMHHHPTTTTRDRIISTSPSEKYCQYSLNAKERKETMEGERGSALPNYDITVSFAAAPHTIQELGFVHFDDQNQVMGFLSPPQQTSCQMSQPLSGSGTTTTNHHHSRNGGGSDSALGFVGHTELNSRPAAWNNDQVC